MPQPDIHWLAETAEIVTAAGLDPGRWHDLPRRLAERFPGARIALNAFDTLSNNSVGLVACQYDREKLQAWQQHYCRVSPYAPFWNRVEIGRAFSSEDTNPVSAMRNTEFYNDWLKPQKTDHATGIKLFGDSERLGVLNAHYAQSDSGRYRRPVAAAFVWLAPYMRSSLALNRHLALENSLRATLATVLDALTLPALILDRLCALRFANAQGSALIGRGALISDGKGRIRPGDARMAPQFAREVAAICAGGRCGIDLPLRSREGRLSGLLTLLPVSTDAMRKSELTSLFAPERLVLVLIRERAAPLSLPPDTLRGAFGLTPAEARLAARLAGGDTLEHAADALNVTKETARSQLKQVFAKTETHRQSELVALLARLFQGGLQ